MNAQKVVDKLRVRTLAQKGQYPELAKLSGLSMSWIMKFTAGERNDPKLSTVESLNNALTKLENRQRTKKKRENQKAIEGNAAAVAA